MSEAVDEWADEHAQRLYRAAVAMAPEADPDDLCQEVFVVATRRSTDFEGRSTSYTWLYGILRNVVRDWRRKRRRFAPAVEATPVPSPERLLALQRDRARLHGAIADLPVEQQLVVTLFYLEEHGVAQVAELLGIPQGTVKSRLYAARRVLRDALEGDQRRTDSTGPVTLVTVDR